MREHVVVWDGRRESTAGPYLFVAGGLLSRQKPLPAREAVPLKPSQKPARMFVPRAPSKD